MRCNRSGQLARMASGIPLWPVRDPIARDADTATPCLSPAETVRPPQHGHCPTRLNGRTSTYSKHLATGLADLILGYRALTRCQPRGY